MPLGRDDLAAFLRDAGVPHAFLESSEPTPTVEAAAKAHGVPVASIVKSVLFARRDGGGFLLVLARGLARVDPARLEAVTGHRWRLATRDEVARATGYAAGTVPPVGHASSLDVLMDARVALLDEMVAGGGSVGVEVKLRREDVARLTGCRVAEACSEGA